MKKFREETGKFLIEGEHLINECLNSEQYKDNLEQLVFSDNFQNKDYYRNVNANKFSLSIKKFKKLADTVSPQGILGVVKKPILRNTNVDDKLIIALENINDPGNLGTIIRTAYWYGTDKILLSPDCADIYNPKTIRSTQGAIFNVNIQILADFKNELVNLFESGWEVILAVLNSRKHLNSFQISKKKKYVLVFGNESHGLSDEVINTEVFTAVKIKSRTKCESLNVAIAAGIFMDYFTR